MDVNEVAKAIGMPVERWPGQCYGIALGMVEAGLVPDGARAVYGHWLGPVADNCPVPGFRSRPFVQHGWVLLPNRSVVDPTRWVFEAADPYVWHGMPDYYDEGGNMWRLAMLGAAPGFEDDHEYRFEQLSSPVWTALEDLVTPNDRRGHLCLAQVRWLGNLPPAVLGIEVAAPFFAALEDEGMGGIVPIDNMRAVEAATGGS